MRCIFPSNGLVTAQPCWGTGAEVSGAVLHWAAAFGFPDQMLMHIWLIYQPVTGMNQLVGTSELLAFISSSILWNQLCGFESAALYNHILLQT